MVQCVNFTHVAALCWTTVWSAVVELGDKKRKITGLTPFSNITMCYTLAVESYSYWIVLYRVSFAAKFMENVRSLSFVSFNCRLGWNVSHLSDTGRWYLLVEPRGTGPPSTIRQLYYKSTKFDFSLRSAPDPCSLGELTALPQMTPLPVSAVRSLKGRAYRNMYP